MCPFGWSSIIQRELTLVKKKLGKRTDESINNKALDDLKTEKSALKKVLAKSQMCWKSLDLVIRKSRGPHNKVGIGCVEKKFLCMHIPVSSYISSLHRQMVHLRVNLRKLTSKDPKLNRYLKRK